jgi:anaerobic selenocysteine-containing dehydrogenase
MATHHRTCHLCEAMCGLEIETEGDRIVSVRGDADDVFSHGHICPKGATIGELHHDPDRLTSPLRRSGSEWREVSWKEAIGEAAERLAALRAAHGPTAVATYGGNPVAHNLGALLGGQMMVRALGSICRYTASTVDQLPKQVSNWLLFGHQLLFPVPDVDRTDLMVLFGANPLVSNGSLMSAPGIRRRLRAIQERGGRVVVVDPRRTRTAERADVHHFIRPGTDAFVFAAMARELLAEDREDLVVPTRQAAELREALEPFTAEAASVASGVPADAIVTLARDLARTERAVLYARLGTSTQAYGTLCSWFVDVINLLAGNLDRPGGAMFTEPAADLVASSWIGQPGSRDRWQSRVRGAPEVMGELPVATLAEDITTPGAKRIRGLVTVGGNPVLSTPSGDRLAQALDQLEFMVSVDPYLNETTCHADLILPPASHLCFGHYDLLLSGLAVRNVARWSPPVFPVPQGARSDWDILSDLAPRVAWRRGQRRRALTLRALRAVGPERLLDGLIRFGPHGFRKPARLSLRRLRQHPHGVDLGPLHPCLPGRMPKDHIDLAPSLIMEELARLRAALDTEPPRLALIGRRHLQSNNSWGHNVPTLMKGRDRCTLLIQGVVSLPHGWGHDVPGVRMRVAAAKPGVNANVLTDPAQIDPPSGTAVLTGVPVTLAPA